MKKLVCVLGVFAVLQFTVFAQQTPSEDNWTLPSWVQASPNSGLYGGFNLPPGVTTLRLATVTWKQLNPSDGVYDWTAINNLLNVPRLFSGSITRM